MSAEVFEHGRPRRALSADVRARLGEEHRRRPFVASDVRDAVRRAAGTLTDLPVSAVTFRGGLQLRGVEVDHIWLVLRAEDAEDPCVIDVAFPLFAEDFVALLPRFVAGEVEREELDDVGRDAALDQRVLGRMPRSVRYCGMPVWSSRRDHFD